MLYKLKRLWQRLTRGWDDSEAWNFNSAFLDWVIPRLTRLKELEHGYPNDILVKAIQKIYPNVKNDKLHKYWTTEVDELAVHYWAETLQEMIDGFKGAHGDNYYDMNYNDKNCKIAKKLKKSFKLLSKYFDNLWD